MEGPICTLTGPVGSPGDLDEAIVEAEIVAKGILPALSVFAVVREVVHDELVDVGQGQHLLWAPHEGHGSEGYVGVGRFAVPIGLSGWPGHDG